MVEKKTWKEFREIGLLWWINMILHTFGWAIVLELDDSRTFINAYPARVKYRGFAEEHNTEGYIKVTQHLKETVNELDKEARE